MRSYLLKLGVASCLTLWPWAAMAHAFGAGSGAYDLFLAGAAVPLSTPAVLFCLVPLGLFVSLWREDGMVRIWPGFLAGLIGGAFIAPFVGPGISIAALMFGIVCALAGAISPNIPEPVAIGFGALGGVLSALVSLEGHGLLELPLLIYAGIVFGSILAVVMSAGLVSATLQQWPHQWLRIGWRILISWSGALGILLVAFEAKASF